MSEGKRNPNLVLLLNRVEAFILCGAGTLAELARFLGKPAPRASEWVTQRKFSPSGEIALLMLQWSAQKTLEVDAAGESMKREYRAAFEQASKAHPVER